MKNFFYQTSKLKSQGSKNFFYGHDGVIEDKLSNVEGKLSNTIRNIIKTQSLPAKNSMDHMILLYFIGLTHLRNPVQIELLKQSRSAMQEKFEEIAKGHSHKNHIPDISHGEAIELALSMLDTVTENMLDLEFKLLKNETKTPFIGSDFPVVKYNSYLQKKNWLHGKTGYGNTGLQIIIPLNSELAIIFYDSMIYKVGVKKSRVHNIHDDDDVDQLNILQVLNCYETLFFDEKCTKLYMEKIVNRSNKYQRANQLKAQTAYGRNFQEKPDPDKNKNLIIMGSTDCEIHLNIHGIKIHSGSLKVKMHPSVAQMRPWTQYLRKERKNNRR